MKHKLVCCFCVAVLLFVLNVKAQNACKTSTNDEGICIPVANCTHLKPILEFREISTQTVQYIEGLKCGAKELDLVCCVGHEIKNSTVLRTDLPEITTTNILDSLKNETEDSLFEHLLESRFSPVREETCKTPNNTDGTCKVIFSCPQYISVIKNEHKTDEDVKYIQRSYCGKENGNVKVCCPVETPVETPSDQSVVGLSERFLTDTCRTPTGIQGSCIILTKCPTYLAIYNKKPISRENIQLLRAAQCGQEFRQPKLCCPDKSGTLTTTRVDDNEKIPNSPYLPSKDECGKEQILNRIRNGQRTSLGEYPWMGLLQYSRENKFYCGGVLINKKYILTAAHCVTGANIEQAYGKVFNVRLGEYNLEEEEDCVKIMANVTECSLPPQNIPVEEIITHPNWVADSKNVHNDIALIRLRYEANYTDFVRAICLPLGKNFLQEGTKGFATGWGITEIDLVNFSPYKLKVHLPIMNRNECKNSLRSLLELHDGQFCAGGPGVKGNVCSGDSGGPLMIIDRSDGSWYSVGVISAGISRCRTIGIPSLFTNVRHYLKWIISNLRA